MIYYDTEVEEYLCFRHAVLRAVTFRHDISTLAGVAACIECTREREALDRELLASYERGQDDAHSQFNKRQTRIQDSGLTPIVEGAQPVADLLTRYECIGKGA